MKKQFAFVIGTMAFIAIIIMSFVPPTKAQGYITATPQYITATPSGGPQIMPNGWTPSGTPMPAAPTNVQTVAIARKAEPFHSPVQCTSSFNNDSAWVICEPGVLLNASTAWTIPGTDQVWHVNCPEGGFCYFSMGGGSIKADGVIISLLFEKGVNYLVLIRGRIDDGIVDSDLNITAQVYGFKPGHAIWAIMPPGAYVSKDWFRQQLVTSTTTGGTNCGATGCSRVKVILFDVDSHFFQEFEVQANWLDNWKLVASN